MPLLRVDLKMPPGKLAAQAGHAYLETYLAAAAADRPRAEAYRADGIGTKIALSAACLEVLLEKLDLARSLGLPAELITDTGHIMPPHFDGGPIITALGIGPATREEVRPLLRNLPLL